jgi:hypothetical protein
MAVKIVTALKHVIMLSQTMACARDDATRKRYGFRPISPSPGPLPSTEQLNEGRARDLYRHPFCINTIDSLETAVCSGLVPIAKRMPIQQQLR